jgi:carbon storage regulator CsrA
MLVLSRRAQERLVFPNLGVTLQVLQIKHNLVKLGIEAPASVRVLREELQQGEEPAPGPSPAHALANMLNKINLSLHIVERQWLAGQTNQASATLGQLKDMLTQLDPHRLAAHVPVVPPPAKKCRTLVVEDDTNERELLAGLLAMNGCECRTAADGQEALDFLSSNQRPDFVLMDVWMPRCDGRQALRAIRGNERFRDVKVFAISGSAPPDANADGFDAWFTKPLNPSKLWEAIQKNLDAGN